MRYTPKCTITAWWDEDFPGGTIWRPDGDCLVPSPASGVLVIQPRGEYSFRVEFAGIGSRVFLSEESTFETAARKASALADAITELAALDAALYPND